MQHLLRETAFVVQHVQEIFQQTGGKVSEGSRVAEVVCLLILQVQEIIHLRPVMAAIANPLVVSGDHAVLKVALATRAVVAVVASSS